MVLRLPKFARFIRHVILASILTSRVISHKKTTRIRIFWKAELNMMDLTMINEDVLRGNHGLSGLKHCIEISEEQPKKRICGPYRRIPCRARSLSIQHNGESAYFEVPHDAPHGMQLNCSHEECINSGRRFRYCNGELPVLLSTFRC